MSPVANEGIYVQNTNQQNVAVDIIRHDKTSVSYVKSRVDLKYILERSDQFLVIDENVYKLHQNLFENIGEDFFFIVGSGESNKSWNNLSRLLDKIVLSSLSRKGNLIAIGGGVVTDMTGLAANLYFRGVKVSMIPTTLLAMVDAAVGGKVAVNHPHQKNMLGSFYHPSEIIVHTDFLKTLPERHLRNGLGEVVKLAILSDTKLFKLMEDRPADWQTNIVFQEEIVAISVTEKMRMLGANCFERDLERPLNLGHSIAHPLEDITDFATLHGEAVSFGVIVASNISMQRGSLKSDDYSRITQLIKGLGLLDNITDFDRDMLWERVRRLVAQRGGKGLLYVLPTGLGSCNIVNDITEQEFHKAIDDATVLASNS